MSNGKKKRASLASAYPKRAVRNSGGDGTARLRYGGASRKEMMEAIDRIGDQMFMVSVIAYPLGLAVNTYFQGIRESANDIDYQYFARYNRELATAVSKLKELDRALDGLFTAIQNTSRRELWTNPVVQMEYELVTQLLENTFGVDADGRYDPQFILSGKAMEVLYLPHDLAEMLRSNPLYKPYIGLVDERLRSCSKELSQIEGEVNGDGKE